MNIAKPAHGYDVSFEPSAKSHFDDLCADASQCRRVISLLNRLVISGHVEGEPVHDDERPGLRAIADGGRGDTLAVAYSVRGDRLHIWSIRVFEDSS